MGRNDNSLSLTCAEPIKEMRDTANLILPRFFGQLDFPYVSYDLLGTDLKGCVNQLSLSTDLFDLISLSFTFPAQDEAVWPNTTKTVIELSTLLKPGGVMLFLTPNAPTIKKQFMNYLAKALCNEGLQERTFDLHGKSCMFPKSRISKEEFDRIKHPQKPMELLEKINRACFKQTKTYPLGQNFGLKGDRPYYSFPGTIQAFYRPTNQLPSALISLKG